MNQKFFDLPEEKQQRIINSALTVFSKYDYKKHPPMRLYGLPVSQRDCCSIIFPTRRPCTYFYYSIHRIFS